MILCHPGNFRSYTLEEVAKGSCPVISRLHAMLEMENGLVFGYRAAEMHPDSDNCSHSISYPDTYDTILVAAECTPVYLPITQAYEVLSAKDHRQRTLLIHAAAAGKAPLFREVFHAMEMALTDEQVIVGSGSRLARLSGFALSRSTPLRLFLLGVLLHTCYPR